MRIGAVNYLNSKPLVYGLDELGSHVRVVFDLPSRLADSLAAGQLDVALIPSIEWFRSAGHEVVSDACVACRGPVFSVKLHFRVPPAHVETVALDEGSRTSAALARILLAELYGRQPRIENLPIGADASSTAADAVLLIGDRAIAQTKDRFCLVWDLGEEWCRWTGLPFVFAMWVARPEVDASSLSAILAAARDRGEHHIDEIAAREARSLGISAQLATAYLRDNLHFRLGDQERRGLRRFHQLCAKHGLAPQKVPALTDKRQGKVPA
jgi:chorismate dehydratase